MSATLVGEEAPHAITEEVRSTLRLRIDGYQTLLLEYQTPLFHDELLDAIKLHEETLQRPEPTPAERQRVLDQLTVLDNMNDRLNKHWEKLHRSLNSRTILLYSISEYSKLLGSWLILDYAGRESVGETHHEASAYVTILDKFRSGEGDVEANIRVHRRLFRRPLEEMMLNRQHVEKRLRMAAAGPSYPTGEIHRLVDQCDWPNLAAAIVNDREIAAVLFRSKPLDPQFWEDRIGKMALWRIDDLRDKYFAELSSPTTYTLTKLARELSAKQAALAADQSSPSSLSSVSMRNSGDSPAVTAARSVYNKVVSGLGLARTRSSLRSIFHHGPSTATPQTSLDSETHLIKESEKAE
ncbi:hypothetical protein Daus18300_004618 [Diaporthe australafricana]|uniref:Uncharacterized protein n=1 Tax=Diaporthe australafricana TaxID=127596 RepID=A0ABR3X7J7_9PEZI